MDVFSLLFEQDTAAWTPEFLRLYLDADRDTTPPFLVRSQLGTICSALYQGLKTCPELHGQIQKDYDVALKEYGHMLIHYPSNEANILYMKFKDLNFDEMDAVLPCGVSSADLMLHSSTVEPHVVIQRLSTCKWPYHVFFPIWETHQDRCNDQEYAELMQLWINDMQYCQSSDDVPTTPPAPNTPARRVLHAWLSQFTDINAMELKQIWDTMKEINNHQDPEVLDLLMDNRWSAMQYDYPDLRASLSDWIRCLRPNDPTVDLLPTNDALLRQQWPAIKASWSSSIIHPSLADFSLP